LNRERASASDIDRHQPPATDPAHEVSQSGRAVRDSTFMKVLVGVAAVGARSSPPLGALSTRVARFTLGIF
jgi:hypothetical protein